MSFDWQTYENVWRWWTKTQQGEEARASVQLDGTTCWYCDCGEVLNTQKSRTHECEEAESART